VCVTLKFKLPAFYSHSPPGHSVTVDTPLLQTNLLANLPEGLRGELLAAYGEVLKNFRERRWEPSELNGGKLCEIVYSIVKGYTVGKYPSRSSKPRNMVEACRALENEPASLPRSVRVQIPRMLMALYEIRNNRGVGHVGGDVDPNHMDATCVLAMSKWLVSELVRVFHNISTDQATAAIDALVERTLPVVWKVGANYRVLSPSMSMRDRTLTLLYHSQGRVSEADVYRWVEHSSASNFRRDVIRPAHREKLLEYDPRLAALEISPLGIAYVEDNILNA
jgi:hypothetical protein